MLWKTLWRRKLRVSPAQRRQKSGALTTYLRWAKIEVSSETTGTWPSRLAPNSGRSTLYVSTCFGRLRSGLCRPCSECQTYSVHTLRLLRAASNDKAVLCMVLYRGFLVPRNVILVNDPHPVQRPKVRWVARCHAAKDTQYCPLPPLPDLESSLPSYNHATSRRPTPPDHASRALSVSICEGRPRVGRIIVCHLCPELTRPAQVRRSSMGIAQIGTENCETTPSLSSFSPTKYCLCIFSPKLIKIQTHLRCRLLHHC